MPSLSKYTVRSFRNIPDIIRSHPLASGLVAAYVPSGNNHAIAAVNLVSKVRGVVSGNPTSVIKQGGLGWRGGGTNDLITEQNQPFPISANAEWSLFGIFETENTTATDRKRAIRWWQTTNGSVCGFEFEPNSTVHKVALYHQYTAGSFDSVDGNGYAANQIFVCGGRWKASSPADLFVDGALYTSSSSRSTSLSKAHISLLGNTSGGGLHLRGTLYRAYFWNRYLSEREMANLYANPDLFLDEPDWRFYSFGQPAEMAGGHPAMRRLWAFPGSRPIEIGREGVMVA